MKCNKNNLVENERKNCKFVYSNALFNFRIEDVKWTETTLIYNIQYILIFYHAYIMHSLASAATFAFLWNTEPHKRINWFIE